MRTMDFTTEQPDCCSVGDYLEIVEHELPTSYWYMLEHAYGASTNVKFLVKIQGKIIQQYTGMDGFTVFGGKMIVTYR